MGDRAQVNVIGNVDEEWGTDIWLYTHWRGHSLPSVVKDTIARGERWGDPEYLARMLFSAMTRGEEDAPTGYGIGNAQHGDVYRVITVNVDEGEVTFDGYADERTVQSFEGV